MQLNLENKPKTLNDYFKREYGLKEVNYSIIFSITTKAKNPIRPVLPLKKYHKVNPEWIFWLKFGNPEVLNEEGYKTYKYIAVLNQEEFDNFCEYFGLSFECGTAGAIGSPAYNWFSLVPATSFMGGEENYNGWYNYNAYITPVLEFPEKQKERLFKVDDIESGVKYEDVEEAMKFYYP